MAQERIEWIPEAGNEVILLGARKTAVVLVEPSNHPVTVDPGVGYFFI